MLTFTHNVDTLPNCPDFHSYTLSGDYLDCDGSTVSVGEYSANLARMLKTLEYYLKDSEVEIVYQTIVKQQ